jgi:O-antigen/teichoic acid export membrane protein
MWAIREAAQQRNVHGLAAHVIPLRLVLATGAFGILLALVQVLPAYPALKTILILFGLTLFVQAASLKWVFMGQEQMTRVAVGLALGQSVFAVAVFVGVHDPAHILWVPGLRLISEVAMAGYFLWLYTTTHGRLRFVFTWRYTRQVLPPALTLGASQALGLMNYNCDAVLLGLLLGPTAVGWYTAAYKPVTAALALPLTYFLGLFPALARTYTESPQAFRALVERSLRLAASAAIPFGLAGTLLAQPIMGLLFGPAYANAVPALQILAWAAALVMVRGTYRQAFNAMHKPHLDLRCAGTSVVLSVVLNFLLIPRYSIIGAAVSTLVAEALWLTLAAYTFSRHALPMRLLPSLWQPALASVVMGVAVIMAQPLSWGVRALLGGLAYCVTFLLLDDTLVRSALVTRKAQVP